MIAMGSGTRLPLWFYGVLAGVLDAILVAAWGSLDTASRLVLLVPAVFWTLTFLVITWLRRSARA